MEERKPSEEALELYQEFLHDCTKSLRDEDPKFLDLIKTRYEGCDEQFRSSSKMMELLQQTQSKMKNDKSRKFVHLKDFLTELKKFSTYRKKKKAEKRQSKSSDSEIGESPVSKFPKLDECSVVLVKVDATDEYDNSSWSQLQLEAMKENKCLVSDGSIDNALTIEVSNTDEKQMSKEYQKISESDYPFCPSPSTSSQDTIICSRSTLSPEPGCSSSATSSLCSGKSKDDDCRKNKSKGKSKDFICRPSAGNLTSSNNGHTTVFRRKPGAIMNEEMRQTMSSDSETDIEVSPVTKFPKLAECSVILVRIDVPDEYGNSSWSQEKHMPKEHQESSGTSKHNYSLCSLPSTSSQDVATFSKTSNVSPLPWCGSSTSSSVWSRNSTDDKDLKVESTCQSEDDICTTTSSRSTLSPVPECSSSTSGSIGFVMDSSSSTSRWFRNSTDDKDWEFESNGKIKDTTYTRNLMRSHVKTESNVLYNNSIAIENMEYEKEEEKGRTGSSDCETLMLADCSVVLVKMEAYDEFYRNRRPHVSLEKTKGHKCSVSVSDGNIDNALTIQVANPDEKQMSKEQQESSRHDHSDYASPSTSSKDTATCSRSRTPSPMPRCSTRLSNVSSQTSQSSSVSSRNSTDEDLEMESNGQSKYFTCMPTTTSSSLSTLSPVPGCESSTSSSILSRNLTDDEDWEFESNSKVKDTTYTKNLMNSHGKSTCSVLCNNSLAIEMENKVEENTRTRSPDSEMDKSPFFKFPKLAECSVVLVKIKMEAYEEDCNNRWPQVRGEQTTGYKCSTSVSDGNIDNALTIEVANADEKQITQPGNHHYFSCTSPTTSSKSPTCSSSGPLSPVPGCGSRLSSVSSSVSSRRNSADDKDWETK